MNHIEFSEKEIRMLIENFEGLKNAIHALENNLKYQCNYKKNICGFFMADFSELTAWYMQKYHIRDGYELPNTNTGSTNIAFSFPEEVYKNFSDVEIIEFIEKNKFNKKQIYINLSFEKFYIRKTLLGKKCAYRAGIVVEKIKTPKEILKETHRNFVTGVDERFAFASANIEINTIDSIRNGFLVSDDFRNILYDFGVAFAYAMSEGTQDKLFLIDEQFSINKLGSY